MYAWVLLWCVGLFAGVNYVSPLTACYQAISYFVQHDDRVPLTMIKHSWHKINIINTTNRVQQTGT